MGYKSSVVEVDLLLRCSTRKDGALKLYRALIGDYPSSNHLTEAQVVQSYPGKMYAVHAVAKIAREKLGGYRRYLKRIKTPGGLKFANVQAEILK